MVVNTDLWNAEDYDTSNVVQYEHAQELLEKVREAKITCADIILDIGCGSGNVTEMVAKAISHKKMIAVDFNSKMVEYANKEHNNGGTIEFFKQDFGLPWDELDERLKSLEGKVDLIWSNRCLHWIDDPFIAASTISRLLKPGGKLFAHTSLRRDPNQFLSEEEKEENGKLIRFDTNEEQFIMWKKCFVQGGLSEVTVQLLEKEYTYATEDEYHRQFVACGPFINSRILATVPEADREKIVEKFVPIMVKQFHTKFGTDHATSEVEDIRKIYNEIFQIIATK